MFFFSSRSKTVSDFFEFVLLLFLKLEKRERENKAPSNSEKVARERSVGGREALEREGKKRTRLRSKERKCNSSLSSKGEHCILVEGESKSSQREHFCASPHSPCSLFPFTASARGRSLSISPAPHFPSNTRKHGLRLVDGHGRRRLHIGKEVGLRRRRRAHASPQRARNAGRGPLGPVRPREIPGARRDGRHVAVSVRKISMAKEGRDGLRGTSTIVLSFFCSSSTCLSFPSLSQSLPTSLAAPRPRETWSRSS